MLNLQKVIQDLKAQKMDLLIDHEITAGLGGRWSALSGVTSGSNMSFMSGASGQSTR
ncbi:MAG: hypothetical protein AAF985_13910 [Bacteroidota bacterium]